MGEELADSLREYQEALAAVESLLQADQDNLEALQVIMVFPCKSGSDSRA